MFGEDLLIYLAISFIYIVSPGPAVFLAINNGITANRRVVLISSLANILGLFLLSGISMLGLGALLLSSSKLFMAAKIIGAIYLIYLGAKKLIQSAGSLSLRPFSPTINHSYSYRGYFIESFLLASTNPKPILFFVALFPQFISEDQSIVLQFFVLTGFFMSISFFVLCSYGCLSTSVKGFFSDSAIGQWFHRMTGGIFIIMGLSLLNFSQDRG